MSEDHGPSHDEHKREHRTEHQTVQSGSGQESLQAPGFAPSYYNSLLGDPRLNGRGNGPVKAAVMRQAQQMYGNRAVQRYLKHQQTNKAMTLRGVGVDAAIQRTTSSSGTISDVPLQRWPAGTATSDAETLLATINRANSRRDERRLRQILLALRNARAGQPSATRPIAVRISGQTFNIRLSEINELVIRIEPTSAPATATPDATGTATNSIAAPQGTTTGAVNGPAGNQPVARNSSLANLITAAHGYLNAYHTGATMGIQLFTRTQDASVDWVLFTANILGNLAWAAACFIPPAGVSLVLARGATIAIGVAGGRMLVSAAPLAIRSSQATAQFVLSVAGIAAPAAVGGARSAQATQEANASNNFQESAIHVIGQFWTQLNNQVGDVTRAIDNEATAQGWDESRTQRELLLRMFGSEAFLTGLSRNETPNVNTPAVTTGIANALDRQLHGSYEHFQLPGEMAPRRARPRPPRY